MLFVTAIALAVTHSYAGESYYVAPDGADGDGRGSINEPWQNLAYAVTVVSPGDTIFMRGGTHLMHEVYVDRNRGRGGAPGQYLTIKAYPGEEPILEYGSRRLIIWADYVRVEGLYFTGTEDLWRCDAFGTGLQIVNNKFVGPQPQFGAIETGGTDILIEGNEIRLESGGNTRDHGIYVHAGENITIRNNIIAGSQGYGLHVFDQPKSGGTDTLVLKNFVIEDNVIQESRTRAGIIVAKTDDNGQVRIENLTIQNNVISGNALSGIVVKNVNEADPGGVIENVTIQNNVISENGLAGIIVSTFNESRPENIKNIKIQKNIIFGNLENGVKIFPGTDIRVYNNTFHQNDYAQIYMQGELNIDIKNNIFSAGEGPYRHSGTVELSRNLYYPELATNIEDGNPVVADPAFMDLESDDFHLQAGSPAIDAGVDVGLPFTGAAPDIGAYEFNDTPTSIDDMAINPDEFTLHQNYPNPFNPETTIVYEVPERASHITLTVYDIMGRKVRTLVSGNKNAGRYSIQWNGVDHRGEQVASGVYYYKLQAFSESDSPIVNVTRRMVLLR